MKAVLLDTCALIWLGFNSEELTLKMREAIETASVLYVSPVSLWEIALKHKKGKLTLKTSPREWYSRVQREYGIMFLPLTPGPACPCSAAMRARGRRVHAMSSGIRPSSTRAASSV